MASLYDIKNEFITIQMLAEEGVLTDEVLADVFANAEGDLADKLEGYCKFIKNMESDIAGLKDEEKRLATRRKALENCVERSKKAMQDAMEVAGKTKMQCGTFTTSIQANPPKVVLDVTDINAIPEEYLTMPEPEVNKAKIKDSLKAGYECEFAHLESTLSLRIR
jgi:hypothetical protein